MKGQIIIYNLSCFYEMIVFLDMLLKKVGLRDKSKVIDLTRKGLTVETLTESKLLCSVQDKVEFCLVHTCNE